MMFWSEPLKVVLATIHVPLAAVPVTLTRDVMAETIDLTARELPRFLAPRSLVTVPFARVLRSPVSIRTPEKKDCSARKNAR
jgi:hypothetical protein